MKCKECKSESRVSNSRPEGIFIKRRRKCLNCTHAWNTYEIAQDLCSTLIKNHTKKYRSCLKCNRVVYAWKFCLEHMKEYKRMDMRERREYWKKTGRKKPKMKKGPRYD